jgi:hypothetical protein
MINLVVKLKGRATLEIKNLKDSMIMDGIKLLRNTGFDKYKIVDTERAKRFTVYIMQYELPSTSSIIEDRFRLEICANIIADEVKLRQFLVDLGITNPDINRVKWIERRIY